MRMSLKTAMYANLSACSPVRVYRRHRALSQTALAAQAGISLPYLNQIEAGKRQPSARVLKTLAAALKLPIDALVP